MRETVVGNEVGKAAKAFDDGKPQQATAKTAFKLGWQWEGIGGLGAEKKRNLTHVFLKTHFGCFADNIVEGTEQTEETT